MGTTAKFSFRQEEGKIEPGREANRQKDPVLLSSDKEGGIKKLSRRGKFRAAKRRRKEIARAQLAENEEKASNAEKKEEIHSIDKENGIKKSCIDRSLAARLSLKEIAREGNLAVKEKKTSNTEKKEEVNSNDKKGGIKKLSRRGRSQAAKRRWKDIAREGNLAVKEEKASNAEKKEEVHSIDKEGGIKKPCRGKRKSRAVRRLLKKIAREGNLAVKEEKTSNTETKEEVYSNEEDDSMDEVTSTTSPSVKENLFEDGREGSENEDNLQDDTEVKDEIWSNFEDCKVGTMDDIKEVDSTVLQQNVQLKYKKISINGRRHIFMLCEITM